MRTLKIMTAMLAVSVVLAGGRALRAQEPIVYSTAQIDQMVAPIALYPDALVSQVLMAATFPDQVAEADQWLQANPGLSGAELDGALSTASWDPSVISLCKFPDLLHRMGSNMQWTTDLGYAFLGQREQVLDSVQRLRRVAYQNGYLRSTPQQTVVVEPQYIVIQPYNPNVVYLPVYEPTVVYGPAWNYPTYYYRSVWAPSPGLSFVNGFAWGVGFAAAQVLFGGCDWNHHNVYVNNTVVVNNTIYRTSYERHRDYYREGRHQWVRPVPIARGNEGRRSAPYGGESHGAVRGIKHLPPAYHPAPVNRRTSGEPYRREGTVAHPPTAVPHETSPRRVEPPKQELYRREGTVSRPPTAVPRETYPGRVEPPKNEPYRREGTVNRPSAEVPRERREATVQAPVRTQAGPHAEQMRKPPAHPAEPARAQEPKKEEKEKKHN
jgi:hypothetical protein